MDHEIEIWRNSEKFKKLFEELDLYITKEKRNEFITKTIHFRRKKLIKLYEDE